LKEREMKFDRTQISKQLCDIYQGRPDDGSERTRPWWGLLLHTGITGAQNAIITEDEHAHVDYVPYRSAKAAREAFEVIVADVQAGLV
jgi:hypothetical protein